MDIHNVYIDQLYHLLAPHIQDILLTPYYTLLSFYLFDMIIITLY
nr:MAG TPA: hypothetical protein [Caudoviricetes sp.]